MKSNMKAIMAHGIHYNGLRESDRGKSIIPVNPAAAPVKAIGHATKPVPVISNSPSEREFISRAKRRGWKVLRHGWPDFLLIKRTDAGFEFIGVEVKTSHHRDIPRDGQKLMLAALTLQGLPCFIWSSHTHTLRKIRVEEATRTMNAYFQQQDALPASIGVQELEALGVNISWH